MDGALDDGSGATVRWLGAAALVALVVVAALDPTEATRARAATFADDGEEADPFGLRRINRFPERFSAYPGAPLTPMGILEANGNPMELHFFVTPDRPEQVLRFYASRFTRLGHHVDFQGGEGVGLVSFWDASAGELVSVLAVKQDEKTTVAFPSLTGASERPLLAAEPPPELPAPTDGFTALRIDDPNARRAAPSTTVIQMARGSPEELSRWYRDRMRERGWKVDEERDEGQVRMSRYVREGRAATVTISALAKGDAPESVLNIILEGTP